MNSDITEVYMINDSKKHVIYIPNSYDIGKMLYVAQKLGWNFSQDFIGIYYEYDNDYTSYSIVDNICFVHDNTDIGIELFRLDHTSSNKVTVKLTTNTNHIVSIDIEDGEDLMKVYENLKTIVELYVTKDRIKKS